MVTGIAATLFDFQEQAVIQLLDLCTDSRSKQTIVMNAPTWSTPMRPSSGSVPVRAIWKNRAARKCGSSLRT